MSSKQIQRDLDRAVALAEERSASRIKILEKDLERSREANRKLQIDVYAMVAEKVDLGTAAFVRVSPVLATTITGVSSSIMQKPTDHWGLVIADRVF
jgi:hypothetical protein